MPARRSPKLGKGQGLTNPLALSRRYANHVPLASCRLVTIALHATFQREHSSRLPETEWLTPCPWRARNVVPGEAELQESDFADRLLMEWPKTLWDDPEASTGRAKRRNRSTDW
jgi:hypothetical protein